MSRFQLFEWVKNRLPSEEETKLTPTEKTAALLIGAIGALVGTNPSCLL
jgi:hypothetical protein